MEDIKMLIEELERTKREIQELKDKLFETEKKLFPPELYKEIALLLLDVINEETRVMKETMHIMEKIDHPANTGYQAALKTHRLSERRRDKALHIMQKLAETRDTHAED